MFGGRESRAQHESCDRDDLLVGAARHVFIAGPL